MTGLRVTDAETVDIARMVLVGKVNPGIVSAINVHGALAVGVSGESAGLIEASPRDPALGFVGEVANVNPAILERLLAQDLIPVVATIGSDAEGQAYNINADTVAGAIAESLRAEKLVYLTDIEGLRRDASDPGHPHPPGHGGRARRAHGGRHAHGRHDPEGRVVRARGAQRRRPRPHPRRAHPPRPPARDLHRRRDRHHGASGEPLMTATVAATPTASSPLMPTYAPPPVTFVRGEGTQLWDVDGKRYLDFLSGLAVTSLGHSHPVVADALYAQATTLLHTSNLFGTTVGPEVATTIDELISGAATEPTAGQVFFCNSGAEANECAIKLARKWGGRGRHVVVSAYGSFHGRTLATLHATGQPAKHEVFWPLPEGFRHVAWCDADALEASLDPSVSAVLLEPVQGEGGVNPATAEYFAAVRRICDERGLLFMVDEVQTGFGRTGEWFGFQHFGVEPDVVTMAKALGNGVPIGACWARRDVAAAFVPGDHATTFGGTPLATAAARAVLAEMQRIDAPRLARGSRSAVDGAAQRSQRREGGARPRSA